MDKLRPGEVVYTNSTVTNNLVEDTIKEGTKCEVRHDWRGMNLVEVIPESKDEEVTVLKKHLDRKTELEKNVEEVLE